MHSRSILEPGTVLDDYQIEGVLGTGAFGITYLAADLRLDTKVAVKEFHPLGIAHRDCSMTVRPTSDRQSDTFNWGRKRFIDEARTLARFEHPSIVQVTRVFEANGTAYMVMRFERGESLEVWLRGLGRAPTQQELDRIVSPLLDALEVMHAADFLHRDIAPDNIIVRADGSPVLLDFGSARQAATESSTTLTGVVKPGYSPPEQYASDSRLQGPWSDIYAFGATLYRAVTGRLPEQSTVRALEDEMPPAADSAAEGYRRGFLETIDTCLNMDRRERPQSVVQLRSLLRGDLPQSNPLLQSSPKQAGGKRTQSAWVALVGTALLISVALLGGAYYGVGYMRDVRHQEDRLPAKSAAEGSVPPESEAKKQASAENARPKGQSGSPRPSVLENPTLEQERSLPPGAILKDCDNCPDVVVIAPGTFVMGSPANEPQRSEFEGPLHAVSFSRRFAAGKYAVTRAQYSEFVRATGHAYDQACFMQDDKGWVERAYYSFLSPGFDQTDDHPVVCVSWEDAVEYTKWLSRRTTRRYRLLSEAEREYVARAGTASSYWWGSTATLAEANFDTRPRNSKGAVIGGTVPVDRGRANPWGLFHVHGNVAEWVQDCWHPDYSLAAPDGTAVEAGECSLRIVRGGAWTSWPEDIRAAFREMANRNDRYYNIGFRVARTLAE
jgi:formylglycine-generating enzyme required for sulfatase activity